MNRVPNWNVELVLLAKRLIGADFVWGETDCVSVVRKALVAMYGEDIAAPHIGVTYTTKTGAVRAFNKIGSVVGIIEDTGGVEIPLCRARDGDIIVFPKGDGGFENLAVKMGGTWVVASAEIGKLIGTKIFHLDDDASAKAYRI